MLGSDIVGRVFTDVMDLFRGGATELVNQLFSGVD